MRIRCTDFDILLLSRCLPLLQEPSSDEEVEEDEEGPSHRYPLRDRARLAAQQTPPKEQDQGRGR